MKLSTFGAACTFAIACAVSLAAQNPQGTTPGTTGSQSGSQSGSQTSRPSTQGSSTAAGQTVTLTGCIETSTSTTGGAARQYVLNNATMAGTSATGGATSPGSTARSGGTTGSTAGTTGSTGSTAGTTGTTSGSRPPVDAGDTGRAESRTMGSQYILSGRDAELAQHAGHRVEITGVLAGPANTTGGRTGTSSTGGATGSSGTSSPGTTGSTGASGASGASGSTSMAGNEQRVQVTSVRMISSSCTQ